MFVTFYSCNKQNHDPEPAIETSFAAQLSESEAVCGLCQLDANGVLWSSLCLARNVGGLDSVKSVGKLVLLLLPYTGLGPFRALKVQSKLVRLGGGVCSLKTVNICFSINLPRFIFALNLM